MKSSLCILLLAALVATPGCLTVERACWGIIDVTWFCTKTIVTAPFALFSSSDDDSEN